MITLTPDRAGLEARATPDEVAVSAATPAVTCSVVSPHRAGLKPRSLAALGTGLTTATSRLKPALGWRQHVFQVSPEFSPLQGAYWRERGA
ncbi:MAG: hypothetical protein KatS3mg059_0287 [Thermomicrobiales bacterium]|nr:MAG: hypothetical protein KatS3mg059_0287 [Thermomicrobiales bacterium]